MATSKDSGCESDRDSGRAPAGPGSEHENPTRSHADSTITPSTGVDPGRNLDRDAQIRRRPRSDGWKNELVRRRHWLAPVSTRFQPDDEELTDEELYIKYRDKRPY